MGVSFRNRHDIVALPAPADRPSIEYWHEYHDGFGVRVMRANVRNGRVRRSYLARYVDEEGNDKKAVLGLVDEVSFDEALQETNNRRMLAKHFRRTGKKPLPTLGEAFETYIALRGNKLSPVTAADYRKRFDSYLADHQYENVVRLDVDFWRELYGDLAVHHGEPTAGGVARLMHAVYQMLVNDHRMSMNPVSVLKQHGIFVRGTPRQNFIKRAQLPAFWQWLHTYPHPSVRDFMLVQLFTGYRLAVVGQLRFSQYDAGTRTYFVPSDERGNKAKVSVWMPLPDYLVEHVFEPRFNAKKSGDWVLPSHKRPGDPLVSVRGSFAALSAATGIKVGSHDMRRTFATVANVCLGDLGGIKMVGHLLTHSLNPSIGVSQQTGDYVQLEKDDVRAAINRVALTIVKLATGK